jgi:hypothetical protein
MGIVGGASLGPGSPQPVAYGYRQAALGKPTIAFEAKSGQVRTTVAEGKGGSKLSANFAFRPPLHAPGSGGVGETGAFVDAKA